MHRQVDRCVAKGQYFRRNTGGFAAGNEDDLPAAGPAVRGKLKFQKRGTAVRKFEGEQKGAGVLILFQYVNGVGRFREGDGANR